MSAQSFTRNYTDHSNNMGFQFEFHCDKCGNGYRSSFKPNTLGVAAGVLRAAGNIFGGVLGSVGRGADQMKDVLRGSAWDEAFREASDELRAKFHQCTHCGKWVCPEVCWNAERGLCEGCAPNLGEVAATAQAQVAAQQVWDKARAKDQTGGADLTQPHAATCAHCSASLEPNARFCAACGKPVGVDAQTFCAGCGAKLSPGAHFCAGCGQATQPK